MLALLQRVTSARVDIEGRTVGAIDRGLLVLVCAQPPDTETEAVRLVERLLVLRVFADEAGKMNRRRHAQRHAARVFACRATRFGQAHVRSRRGHRTRTALPGGQRRLWR
jgi:D-Tyr-tRNAtyr deacylase